MPMLLQKPGAPVLSFGHGLLAASAMFAEV
jgi:hypothetical protein